MDFKPLGKRVLVKRLEDSNTTTSGIIIPDNAKEKPQQGEIVAVSDEIKDVKVGDKVAFGKYSGNEIKIGANEYMILNYDDIFGILK